MIMTNSTARNDSGFVDDSDYMAKPDISKLNGYYTDADSVDQDVFSEMRSNVLLVSGDHYTRKGSRFFKRIRDTRDLTNEQKIRLTKNHTQNITKTYVNTIIAAAPGVGFTAKDETNMHDMKVAEMHHSVWQDAIERYYLHEKIDDWVSSFVTIGEVAVKLFFDPSLGKITGYEPMIDPVTEDAAIDEMTGEVINDESKPIFEGEFVFEEVYGFNLLRPPECKDMRKAEWLCIRKMVDKHELLRKFKGTPDIQKFIRTDQDETYLIFDALDGGYKKSSKQTMLREYYYRPSALYPNGYYYITTKDGILDEGELPAGLFPIVFASFDKIQTTPRGRSPVKIMRPYQAEINRTASKIAEHQITLGDDKLIIQNGTKVSAGVALPGVRSVNVTGAAPTVLQGRDGSQYLNYMNSQITEMYRVLKVPDIEQEKGANVDAFTLLYRSASQKMQFQVYIKRFEQFLKELCKLYLELAKYHLSDDAVIWAVGKNEQINIPEFRALSDTCYEVNIEAQADDVETKFGKQAVLNHTLQYAGSSLKPEDIGKILRQMPYANFEEDFEDLTLQYDTYVNTQLALDRGERPPVNQYDDHPYNIRKLTSRTMKPDFKFLAPEIQKNYYDKISLHEQFEAKKQMEIQRAQQGFIPVGGYLVTCDFYVPDPSDKNGTKTSRAKLPYQAVEWLIKQLEVQGASQQQLMNMSGGAQAEIANMISAQGQQRQQPMPPQMATGF